MNILVVEDDPTTAAMLTRKIQLWGHSAEAVFSGQEALESLENDSFDLILLDIFLPDQNGVELIPKFKNANPAALIITMTGHNSRELERNIRELGVIYYLIKPFDMGNLKVLMEHLAQKKIAPVCENIVDE